ncbi:MAG: DNA polymerase III subunit alpha [Calditrichia bacterium]
MSSFVHLHNHTHYSLLDGAVDIKKMFERAAELNFTSLAITDHGNMFGVLDFYLEAQKYNIKPIIGMEAYIAPGSRFDKKSGGKGGSKAAFHLVLIAKNNTGYRNLMKLSSKAYMEGFYYKPRIDKELLKEYHEGLIATSACMKGEIFYKLNYISEEEAIKATEEYLEIFGEDFYLEIQNHGIPDEAGYENIYKLAKEMNVPVIATNDVHYLIKDHHSSHDVLLCIQSGKTVADENRMKYNTTELYLKSVDEMFKCFPDKADALERTLEIAEKCNVEIETDQLLLPKFPLPESDSNLTLDEYLEKVTFEGAKRIFPEITPQIEERLKYELSVIKKTGYAGYFLIVKDFIDFAKQNDIPVGLGRGSVAGSLVAYCTGITRVNPLRYDLLFERFLNPDRVSMPDIDIDFCYERREEVINYVRQKYGEKNVSQIITFGTMASRGVIRDVARALGLNYSYADMLSKLIPHHQGKPMALEEALENIVELKEMKNSDDPNFQELISHAVVLEGLARHASIHAAGIIIAPDDITNYVPLYQAEEKGQKVIATQFSMTGCEKIGLLKMDFLGLRTLTVIHDTVKILQKKGMEIDVDQIPLDDKETFELFCEGNTVGVFQFESSGMQEWIRKMRPNMIEDLIAMNALFRPGPKDKIQLYIDRKYGREKIEYLHPKLKPILEETYGIIVYQEQVMRIASEIAGFSLAQADLLRRAMSKKKPEEMVDVKEEFIEGCLKNNVEQEAAEEIFDLIFQFAGYGFNKSHAAAYAILSFQTAYLKRHYPDEFMAATLNSEINNAERIAILIDECRRMGIEIIPPDVNISGAKFEALEPGKISFGLEAIKNVGHAAISSIIESRKENGPFKNIFHLMQHVDLRCVNKKILEALVQAGALDGLEGTRAQNFAAIETAISFGQKIQQQNQNKSQISMFELMNADGKEEVNNGFINFPPLPDVPEWTVQEKLSREKELLGFYISGHPLDKYVKEIELFCNLDWRDSSTFDVDKEVRAAAIISQMKTHMDKNANIMAFVTFESYNYFFEGVVFASVYEKYSQYVKKGEMVFVQGKVKETGEQSFKMICNEIFPLSEVRNRMSKGIQLIIDTSEMQEDKIEKLQNLIKKYPGTLPLYFEMRPNGNGIGIVLKSRKYSVVITDEFLSELRELLGKNNIVLKT